MKRWSRALILLLFATLSTQFSATAMAADWQPIASDDLKLKDNPLLPGSSAMILYRNVLRDDKQGTEENYVRIKIFTEEGKRYGDITIPPMWDREYKVTNVEGRTIHPDGTIIPFNGQVFEKVVARNRGDRVTAKSFALPDVTAGSIIEYRYKIAWSSWNIYFPISEWAIQLNLFQRSAHFRIQPLDRLAYKVVASHFITDAQMNEDKATRAITLDATNLPGYEEEPYMPTPAGQISRVLFFYSTVVIPDDATYWKEQSTYWYKGAEEWMNKKSAMAKTVKAITDPSDSTDLKLRKIYDYLQTFPNRTYRQEKSEKEAKRAKERDNKDVEDVVKNKSGYRTEINRTFVAMARAAGVDATLVRLTERNDDVLHKDWPYFYQLRWEVAVVRVDGKTIYLDPGTPFCPYGILPWESTGVPALLLDKRGPTWMDTPVAPASDASIRRNAKLQLAEDGSLKGEAEVTFLGADALYWRLAEREADDAAKKRDLEELLRSWLTTKADVEFTGASDWKSTNQPLVAKFKVSMSDFASTTGRRMLVPATFFGGAYKNPFSATRRFYPIEMQYRHVRADDVTITVPASWTIESLPKAASQATDAGQASASYASENGALHFARQVELKNVFFKAEQYPIVRQYFQSVQSEANQQAVLKMTK